MPRDRMVARTVQTRSPASVVIMLVRDVSTVDGETVFTAYSTLVARGTAGG